MAIDYETKHWKNLLNWIIDIPINEDLLLYPLQFANAIRIASNNAVFIFDEVGCGKTLCSAIMAKTYLTQNKDKKSDDILVITTNAVKINKQFEEDFNKIDTNLKPTVLNNLVISDLEQDKLGQKKWGLVIIDEAHEFSNTSTKKYKALINYLRAEKVVFLTATPLHRDGDFEFYKKLAAAILGTDASDYNFLDELQATDPENLLCSKFDPTDPVTRYFKDTLRYLNIHEEKNRAHRVIPEIWEASKNESRVEILTNNIAKKLLLDTNKNSKFIIFVEGNADADFIERNLKEKFEDKEVKIEKIFADKKWKLKTYEKDFEAAPTVLILNYQIGEAGINLPAYDHVIHWYISPYPSRLEQRYGRIDRMTSRHDNLYTCFVLPSSFDTNYTNYKNFHTAIEYTMNNLLTTIPARNVLLTEHTLNNYKNLHEYFYNKDKESLEKLERVEGYFGEIEGIDQPLISDEKLMDIFNNSQNNILYDNDIHNLIKEIITEVKVPDETPTVSKVREEITDYIKVKKNTLNKKFNKTNAKDHIEAFEKIIKYIEASSDQIFYSISKKGESRNPGNLRTIDSQSNGCAKYIQGNDNYKLVHEIVKSKNVIREAMHFAKKDSQFIEELFFNIGKIE